MCIVLRHSCTVIRDTALESLDSWPDKSFSGLVTDNTLIKGKLLDFSSWSIWFYGTNADTIFFFCVLRENSAAVIGENGLRCNPFGQLCTINVRCLKLTVCLALTYLLYFLIVHYDRGTITQQASCSRVSVGRRGRGWQPPVLIGSLWPPAPATGQPIGSKVSSANGSVRTLLICKKKGFWPLRSHSGKSSWRCYWWWRSTTQKDK